jgi:hypothetical protein
MFIIAVKLSSINRNHIAPRLRCKLKTISNCAVILQFDRMQFELQIANNEDQDGQIPRKTCGAISANGPTTESNRMDAVNADISHRL